MLTPEGIIPAMVTPFTKDQQVNEQGLRQLVNRLIDAGVHGLFCLGSNGEFFSLSYDEKVQVAEIVIDEAEGRVPVYIGTGCNSTKETIQLTKKMEEMGASAVSVITPYFAKLTQEELVIHYEELADATRLPIILYNIPGLTGNALSPHTVSRLSKRPNIVGIKDSSGNFDNVLQYIDSADPDSNFSVLAGTDSLILSTLMAGGSGGVAATANLLPKVVVSIYERWKAGDIVGAEKEQRKLRAIRNAFKKGTLPSVLKEAMNEIGMDVGAPRLPVSPLKGETKREVQKIVQSYAEWEVFE